MKFNMNGAWNEAVRMLLANKQLLGVLAGVFFFLPFLALVILVPQPAGLEAAAGDSEKMEAMVQAFAQDNWVAFTAFALVFLVGALSIMGLLGGGERRTVAGALKVGALGLLPFIVCLLAIYIVEAAIGYVYESVTGFIPLSIINLLISVLVLVAIIVIRLRLMLTGPVMAIEGTLNPVAAMIRSWQLVKGNTFHLLGYLILIGVTAFVIFIIAIIIISVLAAITGSSVAALWISAILSSMLLACILAGVMAIFAAIHRQLAIPPSHPDEPTHERFQQP